MNIKKENKNRNADLLALNADQNMPYDICEEDETLHYVESAMAAKGNLPELLFFVHCMHKVVVELYLNAITCCKCTNGSKLRSYSWIQTMALKYFGHTNKNE